MKFMTQNRKFTEGQEIIFTGFASGYVYVYTLSKYLEIFILNLDV